MRVRVEMQSDWRNAPMAPWVHVRRGEAFDPPAPPRHLEGYRWFFVRTQAFEFAFSSMDQLHHCCEVLARNPLPTTMALSKLVGPMWGPNQHWLSRLPARLKRASVRRRIVHDLERAARELEKR